MWDNCGTMKKKKKENKKKIDYPVKRMRMSELTWENLKKSKNKFGKSWNLFMVELLKHWSLKDN